MSRPAGAASPEGTPLDFTSALGDNDFLRGHAYYFPFFLRISSTKKEKNQQQHSFLDEADVVETKANLSNKARRYLAALGINNPDEDFETAALIWHHALAIGYAPAYLEENADGIRVDFPRIPLPATRELLLRSAALGQRIAALLDTETEIECVTSGKIRAELRDIARISRADGPGTLNPDAGDLEVRAGWGHRGKGGVVMPGKGRLNTRDFTDEERAALGAQTHDVYLNDAAVWSNIPARVWDYTIGGYQVIKKWLSYREHEILRRALTTDEAREVTNIARRIAAILLLESQLNDNYQHILEAQPPGTQASSLA